MKSLVIVSVFAFILAGSGLAAWYQAAGGAGQARVDILDQSAAGTTFEVTVPGVEVSVEHRDGRDFSRVTFPGGQPAPLTVGRPEVPMIPVLLAIPTGARVSVHLVSMETQEFEVTPVMPLQPPVPIGHQPDEFVFDQVYYAQDECYPATEAAVLQTAGWHDLGVASIHVYPVQVNPGRGTMKVASRMVVRVDFSGGAYPQTVTGWMIPMYSRLVANWPELNLPPAQFDAAAHEYLAIVPSRWSGNDSLSAMLQWINRRGYRVLRHVEDGLDTTRVKQVIKEEYDAHNGALRWVLLVGTPEEIPTVVRVLGNNRSLRGDYAYSDFYDENRHSVTDYFPEVGIGRICTNVMSQEDLYVIAGKIMAYQRDPKGGPLGHEYDWLSTIQVVSHKESGFFEQGGLLCGLGLGFYDFTRHGLPPIRWTLS